MADKSVSASTEVPKDVKTTVAASVEAAKTEAATASQKLVDSVLPQVKDAADNVTTRGLEVAQSLFQSVEEKKGEVSTQLVEAIKGAIPAGGSGSAESATVATDSQKSREFTVSTDNQPLLASGQRALETTPWWKNCCGVLDLLNPSSSSR